LSHTSLLYVKFAYFSVPASAALSNDINRFRGKVQVVVSGLYIALFEVTQDQEDPKTGEILYRKGETALRKFVIIR